MIPGFSCTREQRRAPHGNRGTRPQDAMQRHDACKTRAENREEHEATSANGSAGHARAYRILKQRAIGRPLKKSQ